MPTYDNLNNNHAFLTSYMSMAKELEYDRYRLATLLQDLNNARNTIQNEITALDNNTRRLQDQIDGINHNIRNLDRSPKSIGGVAAFIAAPFIIIYMVLIGIIDPDSILLFCGGFVVFCVLIPWLITHAIESSIGNREAAEKALELRKQIRRKENEIARINKKITNIRDGRLANSDGYIATCKEIIASHNEYCDQFYAYDYLGQSYRNLIAATAIFNYLNDGTCFKIKGPDGAQSHFDQLFALNQINNNVLEINNNVLELRNQVAALARGIGGQNRNDLQNNLYNRLQKADDEAARFFPAITDNRPTAEITSQLNQLYNRILNERARAYINKVQRSIAGQ